MARGLRWAFRALCWCLGTLIVLLALTLVAARLLLPEWVERQPALLAELSDRLDLPLSVAAIRLDFAGWSPILRLDALGVHDPRDPAQTLITARRGVARLDLAASLRARAPRLAFLRLYDLDISLEHGTDGAWRLLPQALNREPLALETALAILGGMKQVNIDESRLTIRSAADGFDPLALRDVSLTLNHEAGRLRIAADGRLGPAAVRARVDWRHGENLADGSGQIYLQGRQLSAANWPSLTGLAGQGDVAVWLQATDGRVRSAVVDADWQDGTPRPLRLLAHADLSDDALNWRASLSEGRDIAALGRGRYAIGSGQWRASLKDANLTALGRLAGIWRTPSGDRGIGRWMPSGGIGELRAQGRRLDDWALVAALDEAGFSDADSGLSVQGLSGVLRAAPGAAAMTIDSHGLVVSPPGGLPAPVVLDRLQGRVMAAGDIGRGRLIVDNLMADNADLAMNIGGLLRWDDGRLMVDVAADVDTMAMEAIPHYLPLGILGDEIRQWLQQAFLAGTVSSGRIHFSGQPTDFPFDDGGGEFLADLRAENARLQFDPQWPLLDVDEADVVFHNRSLTVTAAGGALGPLTVNPTTVAVADLDKPLLKIATNISGDGDGLMQVIDASPLAEDLGPRLADLTLDGEHRLALDIGLKLFDERETTVDGELSFLGGAVGWAPWDVALEAVEGNVRFDRQGLTDGALEARIEDQAVTVAARREGENSQLRFSGRYAIDELTGLLGGEPPAVLQSLGEGRSDWVAEVSLAEDSPGGLVLRSDLVGIAIDSPVGTKMPEVAVPTLIRLVPGGEDRWRLQVKIGNRLEARVRLSGFPEAAQLDGIAVQLGPGEAQWPADDGLTIRGSLPRFDPAGLSRLDGSGDGPALSALDVDIRSLVVSGLDLGPVRVSGGTEDDTLSLILQGAAVSGTVHRPAEPTAALPVGIKLERLALPDWPQGASSRAVIEAGTLPPLWVQVDALSVAERDLGRLTLDVDPTETGFAVPQFTLAAADWQLAGEGRWTAGAEGGRSTFDFSFNSESLGETAADLGYQSVIRDGPTRADAGLSWPGAPWALEFAALDGTLRVVMGPGRLVDVEPGVGRVLGLISLGSLSRRLRLDFSDLLAEGLAFDSLEGDVSFGNGQATMTSVVLDGPAARVDISGSADLVNERYDQQVSVIPKVSGAVPIAGVLAGGPAVGAALLLAERVLSDQIDEAARYRYHVTGPWSDPTIIQEEAPAAAGGESPSLGPGGRDGP